MTDKSKITDFHSAKKRVGAQKKDKSPLNGGYEGALRKQKGMPSPKFSGGGVKWFHYVQVLLMLGLVVWMMKACNF